VVDAVIDLGDNPGGGRRERCGSRATSASSWSSAGTATGRLTTHPGFFEIAVNLEEATRARGL
jgi:hypothetical protein